MTKPGNPEPKPAKKPTGKNAEVVALLRSIKKAAESVVVEGRCDARDELAATAGKMIDRCNGEKVDGDVPHDLFWLALAALQTTDEEFEGFDVQADVKQLVQRLGGLPDYAGRRLTNWVA